MTDTAAVYAERSGAKPVPAKPVYKTTSQVYKLSECRECGKPYWPRRHDQTFCTANCRKTAHNREMTRASKVYRALYHWRRNRGQGDAKGLFQDVCRIVDRWTQEDKAKGRPLPPKYVRGID